MLSHNLPIKIEPQQNEAYNTKFKTNIVWKQLLKNPHLVNGDYWSANAAYGTASVAGNKLTYTITTKNANQAIIQPSISFTKDHIYLLSCWLTVSEDQVVGCYTGNSVTNLANVKANVRTRIFNVFKSNITSTRTCYIYPARNGGLAIGGTAVLEDGCLYDLTEMFGEGKEMLGRFSFLSNFPNNYYDYNVDGDVVPFIIPVYGGSINMNLGILKITKYNVDLGYLYWQYSAAQASTGKYRKACIEVLFEAPSSTTDEPDLISSGYQTLANSVSYQFTQGIAIATNNSTIYICDERYPLQNDLPDFANAVKGITACGVMPSPVTYNLTPVEIKTLLGNNKISSNATELRFIYKNSQNEILLYGGSNEYSITDGVFNRNVLTTANLFSPKQNLNGYDYPWVGGGGKNKLNYDVWKTVNIQRGTAVWENNGVTLTATGNDCYTIYGGMPELARIPVKEGDVVTLSWEESTNKSGDCYIFSGTGVPHVHSNNAYSKSCQLTVGSGVTFVTYRMGVLNAGDTISYKNIMVQVNSSATTYEPYTNICPIEGYTESLITVEGDRVPDSESERRLKAITRPVFQWDFGLKLKFEGFTFADGTLCQFDNKITAYSLNATIENNECTIPYQLLDENCQGDIVAYINVSGNNYDVVVYEVYIPVIKRPKPENFLRPAIDLPSAVIASFADGADNVPLEKLKIAVSPKQDLHGYNYPWVGGGGKNKCQPLDTPVTRPTGITVTPQADGSVILNGTQVGSSATLITASFDVKQGVAYIASIGNYDANVIDFGVQGFGHNKTVNYSRDFHSTGIALYVTDGTTLNDVRLYPQIEEGSSATTYEPYSNICPITGYTEANVTRTGKNLWDEVWEQGAISVTTGQNSSGNGIRSKNYIPITPSASYYLYIGLSTVLYHPVIYYDADKNFLSAVTTQVWNRIFTVPNNAYYMRFYVNSAYGTSYNNDIAINYPSTVTAYEPYKGQTYNIPFSFEGQNIFTREGETENRYLNGNGAEGTSSNYCISAYIEVEENKRYVFNASMTNLANTVFHAFYDAEKTQIEVTSTIQEGFIAPSNAKYVRLSYRKDAGASDFHISIGTVPHGTLNVKTGILNVDYAYISDLSNYFFSRGSSTYTYIFTSMPLTNMKVPTEASGRLEGIASSGYRISLTTGVNAYFTPYAMLHHSSRLYFRNDDYNNDATSFRASLSGQQAIYELEDPCVYQLTPTEVKTLLGYNNIWADTGEVEVSYYADPYLHFID